MTCTGAETATHCKVARRVPSTSVPPEAWRRHACKPFQFFRHSMRGQILRSSVAYSTLCRLRLAWSCNLHHITALAVLERKEGGKQHRKNSIVKLKHLSPHAVLGKDCRSCTDR